MRGRNFFTINFSSINGDIFCKKMAFSIGVSCLFVRTSSSKIEKILISGIWAGVILQMHIFSSGKRVRKAKSLFLPVIITYESGSISFTRGGCRMPCLAIDFINDSSRMISLSGDMEYEKSAKSMSEVSRLLGNIC